MTKRGRSVRFQVAPTFLEKTPVGTRLLLAAEGLVSGGF
jgi:hypothetical protein